MGHIYSKNKTKHCIVYLKFKCDQIFCILFGQFCLTSEWWRGHMVGGNKAPGPPRLWMCPGQCLGPVPGLWTGSEVRGWCNPLSVSQLSRGLAEPASSRSSVARPLWALDWGLHSIATAVGSLSPQNSGIYDRFPRSQWSHLSCGLEKHARSYDDPREVQPATLLPKQYMFSSSGVATPVSSARP